MCNSTTGDARPSSPHADPPPIAEPTNTTTTTTATTKKGRVAPQVVACMAASLGTLSSGAVNGWTAGTLTSMQEDSSIYMGTAETAWMVGIIGVGGIVGSPIAGRAMDYLGRRRTILFACPVLVAAWIFMALAPSLYLVLLGRAICGLMTSFFFSTVSVYNSEIPEVRVRGRLSTMSSLFITLGVLLSYVAGAFLPWRYSCYVCAAPGLLCMVTMLPMPESPYWLMLKNKRSDAESALRWLRGPHYDINEDLENIDVKLKAVGTKIQYRELLRPRTRKPFLIALFFMTLQQGSGGNILMMYSGNIFLSAGVENHHMAIVYLGLIQLVGTVCSVLLMDKMGRRFMIVVSIAITGVFTILLGAHYYLLTVVGVSWPHTVPLVAMLIAVLGYSFGCRTLPWLASSELFNTTIRSTANTVCLFYNRTLNFTIVQLFPFVVEAAGSHTAFFFFGALCFVFSVVAILVLPETRGKSLEQIQDYFEGINHKGEDKSLKTSRGKDKENCLGNMTSIELDESLSQPAPIVPPDEKLNAVSEKGEITRL